MPTEIHPTAIIEDGAQIGEGCKIGPYCVIGKSAQIGDNTSLQSHVVVDSNTIVGSGCRIFPFASIGTQSQDLKHQDGNITYAEVGNNTIIREYVTIHRGTGDGEKTSVGSDCALLALSHVGHNCTVGDNVVPSHNATLGGHVIVGNHANIGGLSAVHQFCRIGDYAMVAGMARLIQDVLPYTIADGAPAHMRIINKIGMERTGHTKDEVKEATTAFKTLFMKKLKLDDAVETLKNDFPESSIVANMLEGVERSADFKRGLARG